MPRATTPGWKDNGGNLEASFSQKLTSPTGRTTTAEVVAVANPTNGNYDLYLNNKNAFGISLGRTPIASYNASTGTEVIRNKTLYNQFYAPGSKSGGQAQLNNIKSSVKNGVVNNLKLNATDPIDQRNLKSIRDTPEYSSFKQNAPAPERTKTPTPPVKDGQQTSPAATAANTDTAATGGADQSLIQDAAGGADQLAKLFFGDLRYPLERQETRDYDHVLFSAVEYVPAGAAGFDAIISEGGAASRRPSNRMKKENRVGSIMLPMPRNYNDQNSVVWGPDQLNALQAAGNTLIQGILGSGNQVNQAVDNVRSAVGTNAGQLKDYLKAGAASQILGGANILTRTTGAVMNSNLELLFTGPGLRTFNFTYRMTPRERDEAIVCKNIIRSFKQAMAARIRSASLFMYTPHVFFIDFIHEGKPHPFFNRIKPCALLNFGVNYTPDGAYMTYDDGSPIAYELTFSFQELEPIYDVDYKEGDGVSGMGF